MTSQPDDVVFQYLAGQVKPGHPALFENFVRDGDAAVAALHPMLDLPYGPHPRERFDLFAAPDAVTTILYLHAGYWQGRDKAQFRFLAPAVVGAGFNMAFVNYPLCPDVTIAGLTEAVRRAVPVVRDAIQGVTRLAVIGHSAGGHLAAELALTDWRGRGIARNPVDAIIGLSGVYDLEPLLQTPLNDKLRLDHAAARDASPVHRVTEGMPTALFVVGGNETPAFHAQTRAMFTAWADAGNSTRLLTVDDADHFTLLSRLCDPEDDFHATIMSHALGGTAGTRVAVRYSRDIDEP